MIGAALQAPVSAARSATGPVLVCAGVASLALYLVLGQVSVELVSAEPSYAFRIFPWAQEVTRESLGVARDSVARVDVVAAHTRASLDWLAMVGGLTALYAVALWALSRGGAGQATSLIVAGMGAAFLLVQLWSPVMLSTDVFSYIIYGRVLGLYGGNPYVDIPASYPGDPYLAMVYWKEVPSFYGPVWTVVSAGLARVGGDDIALTVLLFRLTTVLGALGVAGMVWLLARDLVPRRAPMCLALWLWNPLTVIETGISGHNESLMLLALLFGCWLVLRGRAIGAGTALATGALVKVVALLPLLPLAMYELRRYGWRVGSRRLGALGFSIVVAALVLTLAARAGPGSLAVGVLGSSDERYTNSVHELVLVGLRIALSVDPDDARTNLWFRGWWVSAAEPVGLWSSSGEPSRLLATFPAGTQLYVLAPVERGQQRVMEPQRGLVGYVPSDAIGDVTGEPRRAVSSDDAAPSLRAQTEHLTGIANAAVRGVGWLGFLTLCVLVTRRPGSQLDVIYSTAVLFTGFLGFVATWVWPWYVLWPLAFAALVPSSRIALLVVLLSVGVLTLYPATGYQGSEYWWLYNFRSILAFVAPVLVFVIWEWAWPGRRRQSRVGSAV